MKCSNLLRETRSKNIGYHPRFHGLHTLIKMEKINRLLDCINFTKNENTLTFHSKEYTEYKGKGGKILHWLPKNQNIEVKVRMHDGSIIEGKGEMQLNKTLT